jgi:hypothetical protein
LSFDEGDKNMVPMETSLDSFEESMNDYICKHGVLQVAAAWPVSVAAASPPADEEPDFEMVHSPA